MCVALDDIVAGTIARPRAITVLVGVFALLTLTLASIGVYGVIAYSVRERTQEIGVRLALGATAIEVCRMVMSRALRLAAIGVVVGLIAAGVFTRGLEQLLFRVDPLDPWTFAGGATGAPSGRRDRGVRPGASGHAHVTQRGAARLNEELASTSGVTPGLRPESQGLSCYPAIVSDSSIRQLAGQGSVTGRDAGRWFPSSAT